jgi:heat shock protein HtpX
MGNTFKTAFLLTALTLLLMGFGRYFGGQNGMLLALAFAVVMNFVSYFYSDKIALTMYRAQPVTREQLPRAYAAIERLAPKMGIPMPKMYATSAGAITMLASMGRFAMIFGGMGGGRDERRGGGLSALFMLIVAPIAASLIQLAVSRSREYQADATGAHFTGNPYALASALQKLDTYSRRVPMAASPSTAHLFIIQPLLGMNFGSLFSTHPPIAKRIERLTGRPTEFMQ